LPFTDGEFDFIRWEELLSSLCRVLCPGGIIEMIEEDIIFPTVLEPADSTMDVDEISVGASSKSSRSAPTSAWKHIFRVNYNPLEATNLNSQQAIHRPELSNPEENRLGVFPESRFGLNVPPTTHSSSHLAHAIEFATDHAVLNWLYSAVWQRRWVNTRPTKIMSALLAMQAELEDVVSSECIEIAKPDPDSKQDNLSPLFYQASSADAEYRRGDAFALQTGPKHSTRRHGGIGIGPSAQHFHTNRLHNATKPVLSRSQSLRDDHNDWSLPLSTRLKPPISDETWLKMDPYAHTVRSSTPAVARHVTHEERDPQALFYSDSDEDERSSEASSVSAPSTPRATSPSETEKGKSQGSPRLSTSGGTSPAGRVGRKDSRRKMKTAMSRAKRAGSITIFSEEICRLQMENLTSFG
ncbi:4330_t:CDS:2, partial [Acaulospora colombiana]